MSAFACYSLYFFFFTCLCPSNSAQMLLFIGKTTLPQMGSKETFRTDRNDEYDIEGWDMETNNISVKVYQSAGSQTTLQVNFPQKGAVPMIIATDTEEEWAAERIAFPWKSYMQDNQ